MSSAIETKPRAESTHLFHRAIHLIDGVRPALIHLLARRSRILALLLLGRKSASRAAPKHSPELLLTECFFNAFSSNIYLKHPSQTNSLLVVICPCPWPLTAASRSLSSLARLFTSLCSLTVKCLVGGGRSTPSAGGAGANAAAAAREAFSN